MNSEKKRKQVSSFAKKPLPPFSSLLTLSLSNPIPQTFKNKSINQRNKQKKHNQKERETNSITQKKERKRKQRVMNMIPFTKEGIGERVCQLVAAE